MMSNGGFKASKFAEEQGNKKGGKFKTEDTRKARGNNQNKNIMKKEGRKKGLRGLFRRGRRTEEDEIDTVRKSRSWAGDMKSMTTKDLNTSLNMENNNNNKKGLNFLFCRVPLRNRDRKKASGQGYSEEEYLASLQQFVQQNKESNNLPTSDSFSQKSDEFVDLSEFEEQVAELKRQRDLLDRQLQAIARIQKEEDEHQDRRKDDEPKQPPPPQGDKKMPADNSFPEMQTTERDEDLLCGSIASFAGENSLGFDASSPGAHSKMLRRNSDHGSYHARQLRDESFRMSSMATPPTVSTTGSSSAGAGSAAASPLKAGPVIHHQNHEPDTEHHQLNIIMEQQAEIEALRRQIESSSPTPFLGHHPPASVIDTSGVVDDATSLTSLGAQYAEDMPWTLAPPHRMTGWYTGPLSATNVPHGCEGKIRFNNGDLYEGPFRHGQMHGNGIYVWAFGDTYHGEFWNNFRHGHGETRMQGHQRYVGNYEYGKPHGYGEHYDIRGRLTHKGQWEHGTPAHAMVAFISNDEESMTSALIPMATDVSVGPGQNPNVSRYEQTNQVGGEYFQPLKQYKAAKGQKKSMLLGPLPTDDVSENAEPDFGFSMYASGGLGTEPVPEEDNDSDIPPIPVIPSSPDDSSVDENENEASMYADNQLVLAMTTSATAPDSSDDENENETSMYATTPMDGEDKSSTGGSSRGKTSRGSSSKASRSSKTRKSKSRRQKNVGAIIPANTDREMMKNENFGPASSTERPAESSVGQHFVKQKPQDKQKSVGCADAVGSGDGEDEALHMTIKKLQERVQKLEDEKTTYAMKLGEMNAARCDLEGKKEANKIKLGVLEEQFRQLNTTAASEKRNSFLWRESIE